MLKNHVQNMHVDLQLVWKNTFHYINVEQPQRKKIWNVNNVSITCTNIDDFKDTNKCDEIRKN